MKKNSILKISIISINILLLIAAASLLPRITKADFQKLENETKIIESVDNGHVPKMDVEVEVDGKIVDYENSRKDIFLSERQLEPFIKKTEQELVDTFNINIPSSMNLTYRSFYDERYGHYLGLDWSNARIVRDNQSYLVEVDKVITYGASFRNINMDTGEGELEILTIINDFNVIDNSNFEDLSRKSFKKNLNIDMPEDCTLHEIYTSRNFYDEGDVTLELKWSSSKESTNLYCSTFKDVDFHNGSGEIISVSKDTLNNNGLYKANFSEDEEKELLNIAIQFAKNSNIYLSEDMNYTKRYNFIDSEDIVSFYLIGQNINDQYVDSFRIDVSESSNVVGYKFF